MRIGVLEWASCGGAVGLERLPESIRGEGWAMCRALIESVARAGYQPVACLHAREPSGTGFAARPELAQRLQPLDLNRLVRDQWRDVYGECDATIVVAPETEGILLELEAWCATSGIRTCSSDAQFIEHAGDKWTTALCWQNARVLHPATELLSQWNAETIGNCDVGIWVLKSRDGAGCEGMQRLTSQQVIAFRSKCAERDRWLVQPWLNGQAYSRTAIVDAAGQCHWLPVVKQHLSTDTEVKNTTRKHTAVKETEVFDTEVLYRGGCVLPEFALTSAQVDCLQRAVSSLPGKACGWVGVDFLIDDAGELIVIEINPRLTTSFAGLSRACDASLAELIVQAKLGSDVGLPRWWRQVEFHASEGF